MLSNFFFQGSALLFTIESVVGDKERFEEFLKKYIAKYAYKSICTDTWKAELYDFFKDKEASYTRFSI